MLIQDFLNKISTLDGSSRFHLFSYDSVRDEDTTELRIQSYAITGLDNKISGFRISTELHNHYAGSKECPCLINLEHTLPFPVMSHVELQQAVEAFIIKYQNELIENMIIDRYTDSLCDIELQAFEKWDRKSMLEAPEELSEVISYIGLSRWASVGLLNHLHAWIFKINQDG